MSFESGDDITSHTDRLEYFIDGHLEDADDLVSWHYPESTRDEDIVMGQLDLVALTPDAEHQLSVTSWLGPDAFEEGARAYSVWDKEGGPMIRWVRGVETADQMECFIPEGDQLANEVAHPELLSTYARLLEQGTPVADAQAKSEDSIHQKPPFEVRLDNHLRRAVNAFHYMAYLESQERDS